MTNQVVNSGYSGQQQAQSQVPIQQSAQGGQVRSYPATSSTASTVRAKSWHSCQCYVLKLFSENDFQ